MGINDFVNPLKRKLQQGHPTAGAWAQIASPITAEILAQAGFDWILFDMEHGPGDILTLFHQLQAINGSPAVPLVRVPWNDLVIIKRVLDVGAYGILVPYVNTAEEASLAVRATRYPPEGIRGVAGSPRAQGYGSNATAYLSRANAEILLLCAVETRTAVENLDDILRIEGLDGIFIGPMDLASSLGYLGDASQSEVQETIAQIESKVLPSDKFLATVSSSWEQAATLFERGYQMVTLMADGVSLKKTASQLMGQFRQRFPS